MKRFVVLGTMLALAVTAGPATAKHSGIPEGGGPAFITGNGDRNFVLHCKTIGGKATIVFQQQNDRVIGDCE